MTALSKATTERDRARVAVVTGSRAEFGLLERSMSLLERAPWCELQVVVAGMHLVEELGMTVQDVEARFPVAARVPLEPTDDTRGGMALGVAAGLQGFTETFAGIDPDVVLVLGDRTEVFAASLAAAYLDIPVAHIHGGDVTGNPIDDFQRDAISRVARLHFAATDTSAERLRAMDVPGELLCVGAPGLDVARQCPRQSRDDIAQTLNLTDRPWIVVLHHANPDDLDAAGTEMDAVLSAAIELRADHDAELVVLYPNNDAGHEQVLEALEARRVSENLHVFRSLAREDYLDLLAHALLLVGNSSSGIIESATLGLPVINVGNRQEGRERDGNVLDVEPTQEAIVEAARGVFHDPVVQDVITSRSSVYGDGRASERIVDAVSSMISTQAQTASRKPRKGRRDSKHVPHRRGRSWQGGGGDLRARWT